MPNLTEPEAIERAKAGDQQAFRFLVESFQGFVYSIAFRFTSDEAEAEDLTQEAFIRLWKNLDRYNPEYKLRTWLGKIITNLSLDFLKSSRKKSERERISMDEHLPVADHKHHENELNARELQGILRKLADQLNPKQKAAFVLRDLEMMDVSEVCELLGETAANLKSNLYYARKNIRENLLLYYKTITV